MPLLNTSLVGFSALAFSPSSIGASIASVSPAVDLVDGAQYSVQLRYQDGAGNAAASETHTEIYYFAALVSSMMGSKKNKVARLIGFLRIGVESIERQAKYVRCHQTYAHFWRAKL